MSDPDSQLYELSVVRALQEMTQELVGVKATAAAQTTDLKAFVQSELASFRQDIYRSVLLLDADVESIKAAMRREKSERVQRQLAHDVRNDRYMYLLIALLITMATMAGRLLFM